VVPLWAEMTAKFLQSGEMVQNDIPITGILLNRAVESANRIPTIKIMLKGTACASPIIKAYFKNYACGRPMLERLKSEEPLEGTRFDTLILDAGPNAREVFHMLFDLPDPSLVEVGHSWDISNGILDHLGPMIYYLHRPFRGDSNNDTDPRQHNSVEAFEVNNNGLLSNPEHDHLPVLDILRTVFSLLEGIEPQTRVKNEISKSLPKKDTHKVFKYTICLGFGEMGLSSIVNYPRPRLRIRPQGKQDAPTIQFDDEALPQVCKFQNTMD
jgi:hypothetical protein